VRLTDRSQIKLMYGSHHQQPQKHGRNDELDPYSVLRNHPCTLFMASLLPATMLR
jgi:hypothetical protein